MMITPERTDFSLMVFGGSGNIARVDPFAPALIEALHEGSQLLKAGQEAARVALRCITIMEDHPRLNAGHGSALNELGQLEMEAAIMNGADLSVGAIAGLHGIKNPILVAELVRQNPDIVKLIGDGAFEYALAHGLEPVDDETLITKRQLAQLNKWRVNHGIFIDGEEEKLGTVGAVVFDRNGNLAAATSTGGLTGKKHGRVGDTSTIGAGTYANGHLAVSGTGSGEDYVRFHIAGRAATLVEVLGYSAKGAAADAIAQLESVNGRGGVIMVDKNGVIGSGKTNVTPSIAHGAVTSEMDPRISLDPADITA